jgi:hypothetical protein
MTKRRQSKSGTPKKRKKALADRPLTKDSFAKTVEILPDGSRKVSLSRDAKDTLEHQRALFREKFGRDLGPGDPVFFDPNAKEPQPLPPLDPAVLESAALEAGIRPEIAYAVAKTGVFLMKENEHLYSDKDKEDFQAAVDEYRERSGPEPHRARRDKPIIEMSELERRAVFDDMERGPNSLLGAMLDEARSGSTGDVVRVSIVTFGVGYEQRYVYGAAEYGDHEGRDSAACSLRFCLALLPNERLERRLVEIRVVDLHVAQHPDPLQEDEGWSWLQFRDEDLAAGDKADLVAQGDRHWLEKLEALRHAGPKLLVSVGLVQHPDRPTRSFCEDVELGDNEGREHAADNVRTARRVGLLQDGETVERFMLTVDLDAGRAVISPDPVWTNPRRRRR